MLLSGQICTLNRRIGQIMAIVSLAVGLVLLGLSVIGFRAGFSGISHESLYWTAIMTLVASAFLLAISLAIEYVTIGLVTKRYNPGPIWPFL